jgi:plasmid stability protein
MATIQIRNLSDASYETMKRRAERAGRSLQEYMRSLIEEQAATLTMDEALERTREIAEGSTITREEIVEAVRADREDRA